MCRTVLTSSTLLIALAVVGCCVEGYPVLSERDVTFNEVPAHVREAFEWGYDAEQVDRVEQTTLMSRCTGYPSKFRFHLKGGQTITLDQKGRLARWVPGLRQDAPTTQGGT